MNPGASVAFVAFEDAVVREIEVPPGSSVTMNGAAPVVIVSDVDALCATLVSCGARCRLILESPAAGSEGQYWCVLSGHVVHGDRRFGPRSLGWCGPGASMPEMRAGADGARLLVMRFPKPINIETDPAADVALSGERTAKEVFLP